MSIHNTEQWLDEVLPKHVRLTQAVVPIIENLLRAKGIDYLTVTGRTKDKQGATEKIKRKGYKDPISQLTDLSGVRIVVYFESAIEAVAELIQTSFSVDHKHSLNKDELLSTNQIGYRSVHFVCDLGAERSALPEHAGLTGLKFEFQVRTALQHAWAELAHDRNYKFSGKLPREIERKLYLYAGMLEIADRGFDEISTQINAYVGSLEAKSVSGDLSTEINSISLAQFVEKWSRDNEFKLEQPYSKDNYGELVQELKQFGIVTLAALNKIIPHNYAKKSNDLDLSTNIYGLVRDWMLIHDWRRFWEDVTITWSIDPDEEGILQSYLDEGEYAELLSTFNGEDDFSL